MTMHALEDSYAATLAGTAVCSPRIDLQVPTASPDRLYQWGCMAGGAGGAYFAVRMKSDIVYRTDNDGASTMEKYCIQPGTFCGLVLLFRVDNGEPLAIINDGTIQHIRVGADAGLGAKYMARPDSKVIGMFGSGGMARSFVDAIRLVRNIEKVQVYSPTPAHRRQYAEDVRRRHGIEVIPVDMPAAVYRGADIVADCTDAAGEVIQGRYIEKGTHLLSVGSRLDQDALGKIDSWLRFGNATPASGRAAILDEYVIYRAGAIPDSTRKRIHSPESKAPGVGPQKMVYLEDVLNGRSPARKSHDAITYSERGNL